MLTPIKDSTKINNTAEVIKSIVPKGSIIKTHCFYDGRPEFDLCSSNSLFVHAETISEEVYLFWECLRRDGRRLFDIVTSPDLGFHDEKLFSEYQEKWNTYKSPHIRAAFFFLLNRCSDTGKISSGQLTLENYNPLSVSRIKNFRFPDNFHLSFKKQSMKDFLNQPTDPETYLFISAGKFNYNLFRHGRNVAAEDTPIDHRILSTHMSERKNKVITSYNYHKGVERFFKNCRFVLVDRHGKQATKREESKEIIVANF